MKQKPNVNTFKRELAEALGPRFEIGKKGIHFSFSPTATLSITPDTKTVLGVRSVSGSIVVYRPQDWVSWLEKYDQDSSLEFSGNGEAGEFGLMFGPEHLLDRPHGHRWSIDDQTSLQLTVEHISNLIEERLLPRLPDLSSKLPNRAGFLSGKRSLKIPDKSWLEITEPCPWPLCLEQGRRQSAGGVYPDDESPSYAISSR